MVILLWVIKFIPVFDAVWNCKLKFCVCFGCQLSWMAWSGLRRRRWMSSGSRTWPMSTCVTWRKPNGKSWKTVRLWVGWTSASCKKREEEPAMTPALIHVANVCHSKAQHFSSKELYYVERNIERPLGMQLTIISNIKFSPFRLAVNMQFSEVDNVLIVWCPLTRWYRHQYWPY